MKLTQRQKHLKQFVMESPAPQVVVPLNFSDVAEMWLEKSGGLEPDEVDPERHDQLVSIVAGALNADELQVADLIADWGSATSMGPMRTEAIKLNVGQLRNLINEVANIPPRRVRVGDEFADSSGAKLKVTEIWLNLWSGEPRPYLKYEYTLVNGETGVEENSFQAFLEIITG